MKRNRRVVALIEVAEREKRCIFATNQAERSALSRRAAEGEFVRLYPNVYARAEQWATLNGLERTMHMVRALNLMHPKWCFAGLTAAAVHGLEHQRLLHSHTLTIAATSYGQVEQQTPFRVRRLVGPPVEPEIVDGIPVTNLTRTALDCARTLEFRFAMPIMDSVLRRDGITVERLIAAYDHIRGPTAQVMRVLKYANPASENGGESLARATIIEEHFMPPEIQVVFADSREERQYRADFVWRLDDGTIIVAEFDGTSKYVNPEMTGRKSIQQTVTDERERERTLLRAGVTTIVRFTFDDVMQRHPLIRKLYAAGVPLVGRN